jgi:CBS domain-containing protein
MKVKDVMTRDVELTSPDATLREAAQRMAKLDVGALPVGENDKLVGMITDRDIAIRAVAQGKGPDGKVRDAMTTEVKYCFEDDDLDQVAQAMAENKVQRLPVMGHDKRLVGIVSLGDLAVAGDSRQTDTALSGIKEPGEP